MEKTYKRAYKTPEAVLRVPPRQGRCHAEDVGSWNDLETLTWEERWEEVGLSKLKSGREKAFRRAKEL